MPLASRKERTLLPANERQESELVALALMDETGAPVGAGRLARALRRSGITVAEPTAGRLLHALDERGYTRTAGAKRGRVITEAGRQRLAELRQRDRQGEHGARMVGAIEATDIADLIDLLYVRRSVETEAARVAAIRATDEELDHIAAFAAEHAQAARHGGGISTPSMVFHRLVAEASHNRLLIAVALLLLDPANDPLERLLDAIALDEGVTLDHVADHVALASVLKTRDAAVAEATMRAHMDDLIRTVETCRVRGSRIE